MRHLGFAALALCACQGELNVRELCAEARAYGVSVRSGSRIEAERVEPGTPVACESAAAVYHPAVVALGRLPARLRPGRLDLELDPRISAGAPVRTIEVHRPSAALLATSGFATTEPKPPLLGVWLHEIAHLRAHGARPSDGVAARLFLALEEGTADYFAAVTSGSSVLGDENGEVRDVAAAPPIGAAAWASLAFANAFDAHHFGWALAAELFRQEPSAGPLLDDLLSALASRDPWPESASGPGPALDELLRRCPPRSRGALTNVLARWVPRQLRQG